MIQAFFFDLQRAGGDRGRRRSDARSEGNKAVVLGAGMMGAGIAYVCAKAGLEVMLKDVSADAAERGKDYSRNLAEKDVAKGRSTGAQADELLARVTPTADAVAAAGAELVIEAVFEDPTVKAEVFAEIEPHVAAEALLGSNTSTLSITMLAGTVTRPEDFIGLHFFSPVERMPLLEIIRGANTSDEALHRALDLARRIRKTPIVVNDSPGFFTSRVIGTFMDEGIAMLLEGVPGPTIEQASSQAGYPAPVLQLSDEVNINLMRKVREGYRAGVEAQGRKIEDSPANQVIERMLDDYGRAGKLAGAGFYDYEDGKRIGLWPGLSDAFAPVADPSALSLRDLKERMLIIESLEAVKCLDEGVIQSVADANIGSIMGIGFPGWTGGVLQYINGYAGGPSGFVGRCRELAAAYGDRFQPPASLVQMAERGQRYRDERPLAAAA
jgi:3-hydroxyacyl-CoA dehydrogenase/enoyl-CoA hydratase/3-hydroxybutyryl-CoA epimerase